LKVKLLDRADANPRDGSVAADSLFRELGDYWLEDLTAEGRTVRRTLENYEWVSRKSGAARAG
jgi:hypothetical protein